MRRGSLVVMNRNNCEEEKDFRVEAQSHTNSGVSARKGLNKTTPVEGMTFNFSQSQDIK